MKVNPVQANQLDGKVLTTLEVKAQVELMLYKTNIETIKPVFLFTAPSDINPLMFSIEIGGPPQLYPISPKLNKRLMLYLYQTKYARDLDDFEEFSLSQNAIDFIIENL